STCRQSLKAHCLQQIGSIDCACQHRCRCTTSQSQVVICQPFLFGSSPTMPLNLGNHLDLRNKELFLVIGLFFQHDLIKVAIAWSRKGHLTHHSQCQVLIFQTLGCCNHDKHGCVIAWSNFCHDKSESSDSSFPYDKHRFHYRLSFHF